MVICFMVPAVFCCCCFSNGNFSTWRTKISLAFSSVSVSFVTLAFIDASVIDNQFVSDGDKKK